jgi:hypothetical protein
MTGRCNPPDRRTAEMYFQSEAVSQIRSFGLVQSLLVPKSAPAYQQTIPHTQRICLHGGHRQTYTAFPGSFLVRRLVTPGLKGCAIRNKPRCAYEAVPFHDHPHVPHEHSLRIFPFPQDDLPELPRPLPMVCGPALTSNAEIPLGGPLTTRVTCLGRFQLTTRNRPPSGEWLSPGTSACPEQGFSLATVRYTKSADSGSGPLRSGRGCHGSARTGVCPAPVCDSRGFWSARPGFLVVRALR